MRISFYLASTAETLFTNDRIKIPSAYGIYIYITDLKYPTCVVFYELLRSILAYGFKRTEEETVSEDYLAKLSFPLSSLKLIIRFFRTRF